MDFVEKCLIYSKLQKITNSLQCSDIVAPNVDVEVVAVATLSLEVEAEDARVDAALGDEGVASLSAGHDVCDVESGYGELWSSVAAWRGVAYVVRLNPPHGRV